MDMKDIYSDIDILLSHVYARQEEAVSRWTNITCDDYQTPIAMILGFLSNAVAPLFLAQISVKNKNEHRAMVEIIQQSHLSAILEFDKRKDVVVYRKEIPDVTKREIASYVDSKSSGIADWLD